LRPDTDPRGLEFVGKLTDLEDLSCRAASATRGQEHRRAEEAQKPTLAGSRRLTPRFGTSARCWTLEELYLGQSITDEGIVEVKNLKKLKQLHLGYSTISAQREGRMEIREKEVGVIKAAKRRCRTDYQAVNRRVSLRFQPCRTSRRPATASRVGTSCSFGSCITAAISRRR